MIFARVDVGVDLAALLTWALTGGFMSVAPTTCRSTLGGSS